MKIREAGRKPGTKKKKKRKIGVIKHGVIVGWKDYGGAVGF